MYYHYYLRVSESGFSDRRLSEPEGPGQSPEALTLWFLLTFSFPLFLSLSLSLSCSHFLSLSLLLSISPILFVCLSVHLSVGLSVFPSLSHSSIYRPLSLSPPHFCILFLCMLQSPLWSHRAKAQSLCAVWQQLKSLLSKLMLQQGVLLVNSSLFWPHEFQFKLSCQMRKYSEMLKVLWNEMKYRCCCFG